MIGLGAILPSVFSSAAVATATPIFTFTNAAIASILLSILLNWVTLQQTKNFVPRERKNEKRLS